jgi:2,4'-dihydroxyacetophenone dioxygenase
MPDTAPAPEAQVTESLAYVYREYGRSDIHIGPGDAESPYVTLLPGVLIRHLSFDVRRNAWTSIIWVQQGGMIGRHRHRGAVDGYVIEGSWKYLEYDWVATAGSFIHESPGVIHTLYSESGMKTLFSLSGPLEFYDDGDNLLLVHDAFYLIDNYLQHCKANKLPINPKLFL